MQNEDKEENSLKSNDEKDKLKKKLLQVKKDSIASFMKIEDEYYGKLEQLLKKYKIIAQNKIVEYGSENLFLNKILDKHIFDKALASVY